MPRCLNPNCKDKFTARVFLQKFCLEKEECIKLAVEAKKEKMFCEQVKKNRKEKKDWHEKNKSIIDHEKEARKEFQKWIRLRDKDLPCISCGVEKTKQWDGGHYLKAELFTGLIFYENNCHKQCSKCNDFLSGNELNYRDGLIARYGREYVEEIEERKSFARVYKFTKQELIEIKNKYKLKNKEDAN